MSERDNGDPDDTITVELTKFDVALIDGILGAAIQSLPEGSEPLLDIAALLDKLQWAISEQKGVALPGDPRPSS